MLPRSEWLHLAERIAVGSSFRVPHTCGAGSPMKIQNKAEAYSAWCHRCQDGGFVSKEHVRYKPVQQESTRTSLPRTAVPFLETSTAVQQHCYRFFIGKGIDPNMLPLHDLLWDEHTHRVIFRTSQGASGRVVQEGVFPKWVHYYVQGNIGSHAVFGTGSTVVFTEDILSAIKYSYSCGCRAIALLGTKLAPDVQVDSTDSVFIALDGDKAGRDGSLCTRRRLLFRGIKSTIVHTPEDKDPKDLSIRELRESLMCQT